MDERRCLICSSVIVGRVDHAKTCNPVCAAKWESKRKAKAALERQKVARRTGCYGQCVIEGCEHNAIFKKSRLCARHKKTRDWVAPGNEVVQKCSTCKKLFSYIKKGSGRAKKYCSTKCFSGATFGVCTVDGCMKKATAKLLGGLCNTHKAARRKYGLQTIDDLNNHVVGKTQEPYPIGSVKRIKCTEYLFEKVGKRHPMATNSDWVPQHRVVAYRMHNGVCPRCYWCNKPLAWASSVVDHLDENKSNNDVSNLVVTCRVCNSMRGATLPLFWRMKKKRFKEFVMHAERQLGKRSKAS